MLLQRDARWRRLLQQILEPPPRSPVSPEIVLLECLIATKTRETLQQPGVLLAPLRARQSLAFTVIWANLKGAFNGFDAAFSPTKASHALHRVSVVRAEDEDGF